MRLSIVTTLFRSASYVEELVVRCLAAAKDFVDVEIILVDDGSPDQSLPIACELAAKDPRITVLELSRNFGHHQAILAGLSYSKGEYVFLIDSDLEEAPELLPEFFQVMRSTRCDVVFGIRRSDERNSFHRALSKAFWRVFGFISTANTPANICNVRLMNRVYVDALCSLPEHEAFLGGLFHWVGFKQLAVPVAREQRRARSTYSIWKRFRLAGRAVIAFSSAPLHAVFWTGMVMTVISGSVALFFVLWRLTHANLPSGYASLIISIWFLAGVIVACIGMLGLYVSHLFTEIKGRPRAIIRQIHTSGAKE